MAQAGLGQGLGNPAQTLLPYPDSAQYPAPTMPQP